ncbi:MAG TPA: XRE family transcriptional regulator [Bryobacteraceae bacterium]
MRETSEETIHRVLGSYDIGRKLRTLRLRKKIALLELARHTGLSASMLSQLETGKLLPTLPTLARIAMVFDVGLDHFFGAKRDQHRFHHVRKEERMRFPERPDIPAPSYFFECLAFATQNKLFDAYLADFAARSSRQSVAHHHDGVELIYVLEGVLTVHFEDGDHTLNSGDSAYFDSTEPHSYRSAGGHTARALVITSPPRT